ncbi:EAL domain-containing protein [Marinomonas sp. THO17]
MAAFSLTFGAAHLLLQSAERKELTQYSKLILANTQLRKDSIDKILSIPINKEDLCREKDLAFLRDFLWTHKYLKDVGRVIDNSILCTAGRGNLNPPVVLPAATQTFANGYQHWRGLNTLFNGHVHVNLLRNNHTIAFVAPNSYAKNLFKTPYSDFAVTNLEGEYVFEVLSELSETELMAKIRNASIKQLAVSDCIEASDICSWAYKERSGLWLQNTAYLGFLTVISLLLGIALFGVIFLQYNKYSSMPSRLKRAIRDGDLYLVYQPKFQLHEKRLVGIEALARWEDRKYGVVSPDTFISLAQEHQMMSSLSYLVVGKAIAEFSHLLPLFPNLQLSINLVMRDLNDEKLLSFIDDKCQEYALPADQLTFEITEDSAVGFEHVSHSVEGYLAKGYKISLDDFGTGYANLSWLNAINASEIKIDKEFTQSIGLSNTNETMLHAIFKLIQDLPATIVFEGIETQEQEDYIKTHVNNPLGQGWLYCKPLPLEDIRQFLHQVGMDKNS